jgi:hypothetical protein
METIIVYIGNEPEPEDRFQIEVDQADYAINCPPRGKRGTGWLKDVKTGKRYQVRRASCGLPRCLCALVLVSAGVASTSSLAAE